MLWLGPSKTPSMRFGKKCLTQLEDTISSMTKDPMKYEMWSKEQTDW